MLILQQGANDPAAYWALPQGKVEADELMQEGMIREIREETGIEVLEVGALVYAAQGTYTFADGIRQSIVFIYEVNLWRGEVLPHDPAILDAHFFPLSEAIEKLHAIPFLRMREPLLAYLQDEVGAGAIWHYVGNTDGSETLTGRQPALS